MTASSSSFLTVSILLMTRMPAMCMLLDLSDQGFLGRTDVRDRLYHQNGTSTSETVSVTTLHM